MKITLIRHGETDFNKDKLIQGLIDNPLNEKGIEQAQLAGEYFKKNNFKFDYIYASTLVRAIRTAEEIAHILDYKGDIITDERFVERDFGEFDGKTVVGNLETIFDDAPGDYEHHAEIEARVMAGLQDVIKRGGEHVLIACHSHTIKATLSVLIPEFTYYTMLVNTSINHLEYVDGKLYVREININKHLD